MTSADVERQVDEIADELYTLRPDAFATERDEQVRKARAQGNAALARELGKLRRPTISAWLINLLWRDQREVLEQLFELADSLTRAQAEAAGDELRQLMTVRRQLELTLIRRAHTLADEAGVKVTDTVEREAQETLAAALAQPEVADEVRTGRLVKPASYAGFGSLAVGPRSVPDRPGAARAGSGRSPGEARPAEVVDLQAAQRARERREAAERRLQEARAAEDAAAAELGQREEAAAAARQQQQRLESELNELRDRLQRLQQDLSTAEDEARRTAHARDQTQKAHQSAVLAVARAEQALAELSG
jgi:hypothetical protein